MSKWGDSFWRNPPAWTWTRWINPLLRGRKMRAWTYNIWRELWHFGGGVLVGLLFFLLSNHWWIAWYVGLIIIMGTVMIKELYIDDPQPIWKTIIDPMAWISGYLVWVFA